jgi:putative DNA primase/helicase
MKKNISRNPLWPDWYNGKKIDEVQFGRAFLEQWPLKCVNGTLYTLDGPVEDESEIKQRILENIEEYVTSGLSKKVTNILETIKLLAFSDPFPIEQDCIHLQNGVYHLPDGSFQESRLFCQNRLPVRYDPKAASPDRWLTFLHELLDDADIPTLQEYLGYCLIPSTKGQKMMLIVGKGGEGKSRIGLVLKRLMGDAASNGSVQKVENNRFARADLERRLLMIDDDMDMNALPKTNYIKTIVTAEAKLDLERKGVQSYQRDIYARFLCFGNGALTSLYDHSDGFFRRQLILTTKDKPADRTDDPFLVEKMCAELEGILLWCLEGLHRLVQNDSASRSANEPPPTWTPSNAAATMSSTSWNPRATSASRRTTPSVPRSSTTFISSGARTTHATAYRRSVSAQNCDRTTSAITLKPPTTSICPVAAGCGVL